MFNKSIEQKVNRFLERLSNKEQNVIADIQKEIQTLRKREKELEEELSDINESFVSLLEGIDLHMKKWAELQTLKEKALQIIAE